MKRILIFIIATMALCCSAAAQLSKEEKDLLELYGATPEQIEMFQKIDEIQAQEETAKAKEQTARTLMLILSLAVAVVPLCVIGKRIIDHPEERTAEGVSSALGIALLGGAVLFGINYGWMWLRLRYADALNFPIAIIITVAIAVGAVFLLTKKDEKNS